MSTGAGSPVVLTEDRGSVRVVTLNRPEARNAIDMPLRLALAETIEAADAAPGVRVVVLTGAGKSFCAGGDITSMRRLSAAPARERAEAAQRVVRALWTTAKPVVAAVEGAAYGAGLALALACDRVVLAEGAALSASFTSVGLAGDMGITVSLPARVGASRAKQMLMLPEPIGAKRAVTDGLADRLVAQGEALSGALEDAHRLASGPPLALGALKGLLGATRDVNEMLGAEVARQVELFDTDDFAEGIAAFSEKRRPVFRGATTSRPVAGR